MGVGGCIAGRYTPCPDGGGGGVHSRQIHTMSWWGWGVGLHSRQIHTMSCGGWGCIADRYTPCPGGGEGWGCIADRYTPCPGGGGGWGCIADRYTPCPYVGWGVGLHSRQIHTMSLRGVGAWQIECADVCECVCEHGRTGGVVFTLCPTSL